MTPESDADHRAFLASHRLAVIATTKRDGTPQQSLVAYALDANGRLLMSAKSFTAKWHNARRQPGVSVAVVDGRSHLVVYGTAETIEDDPLRVDLTAEIFAALSDGPPPEREALRARLDDERRTVLRITPQKMVFHA